MLTQEEKLKNIYESFGEKLKDISEEAIGKLVGEFIPYAADDLESNVYTYSRRLIKDFLSDKPTYEWSSVKDTFNDFNSIAVREKMLKDYRDEIVNDIIRDQEREIANLKERVKWLEELNQNYRSF